MLRSILVATLLMMSQGLATAAADPEKVVAGAKPPTIDIVPHCRAVAELAKPIDYYEVCLRKEKQAHDTLLKQWPQFDPADRSHCTEYSAIARERTYSELLTCLELARDARNLKEKEHSTTGQR
jgi:hypothetical protein